MIPTPAQVLTDPAVRDWVKDALLTALAHDPVDALHDAELLARVLRARLNRPEPLARLADIIAKQETRAQPKQPTKVRCGKCFGRGTLTVFGAVVACPCLEAGIS